jgi:hypothetical protein
MCVCVYVCMYVIKGRGGGDHRDLRVVAVLRPQLEDVKVFFVDEGLVLPGHTRGVSSLGVVPLRLQRGTVCQCNFCHTIRPKLH